MNYLWETLADGVWRTRLPFLDVTVGVVRGRDGALLVDSGTTETGARAIEQDVRLLAGQGVEQIVLTHNHFDHVLGSAWFRDAGLYGAPEVAATMTTGTDRLRADALDHGADPGPSTARSRHGGGPTISFTTPSSSWMSGTSRLSIPDRGTPTMT